MKQVLLLGAGLTAAPLVRYFLARRDVRLLVAALEFSRLQPLVEDYPDRIRLLPADITDENVLRSLIREAELVVSLVPATLLPLVCRLAVEARRPVVSTSYASPEVRALDESARRAGVLLLNEMGFVAADDPRFAGTVRAVGKQLRRGNYVFRYVDEDGFGAPTNAFLVCSFWYVNALAVLGQHDEARELFGKLLECRNRHGLLAEHVDPETNEQWGNFVQTYSMVGLITCAVKLSIPWEQAF